MTTAKGSNIWPKVFFAIAGPLLGFAVWAADARIDQRVQSKVEILDKRLDEIDKSLIAFSAQHEAIHQALDALREEIHKR
jgi:hypothetical protein